MQWHDGGVDFVREDEGLPLNLGILGGLQFRFITIPDGLNHYLLTVRHLPLGQYEIRAEGRLLGKVSERQLHEGLNIASMTADGWEPGGPWDAQAGVIKELTEARHQLAVGNLLRNHFLGYHPHSYGLGHQFSAADDQLVTLQHEMAKPFPYRFEIRPQRTGISVAPR